MAGKLSDETEPPAQSWLGILPLVATTVAREPDLRRVVSLVLDQTVPVIGARAAHVLLADEGQELLRLIGHRNLPPDLAARLAQVSLDAPLLAARAARTREIQFAVAAPRDPTLLWAHEALAATSAQSMVSLPLVAHRRLMGTLTYLLAEPPLAAQQKLVSLRAVGDLLAVAMAQAQAEATEQRIRAQIDALRDAGRSIADRLAALPGLDLTALLQTIVEHARQAAGAEFAALGIVTDPNQPFGPWVFSGVSPERADAIGRFPRPMGTLGQVAREGETINTAHLQEHPAFVGLPPHHPKLTSFLGVPIIYQDQSVGNLYLGNKLGADRFSREDQRAVELLAAHAAVVFQLPRLSEAVEAERARLQTILESADHGIIFVEAKTGRVTANPKAVQLLGRQLDPEAGLAQNVGWFFHPDGRPMALEDLPAGRVFRGEAFPAREFVILRPDGTKIPVLGSAAPVRSRTGEMVGAVVDFQDLTQIKEFERMREEWASIIAHDLRQPVAVIAGYTRLLERLGGDQLSEQATNVIAHIRTAASNLNKMVGDLLDASRIEARRLEIVRERVHLPTLVREVVDRLAEVTQDHPVWVDIRGDIPEIGADPQRLEQALGNLLSNAAKYGFPETKIVVEVARTGKEIQVSVTNQGEGITPEELQQLFNRFRRTRRATQERLPGLGLGLYIAKGLVEAHGGRIWAESAPDQTTTFRFTLPVE